MDNIASPIIGKDIIESLTLSMYEDSKYIYREYIQNSADQIDKAVQSGLMNKEDGDIYIEVDPETQTIRIEDNATGIEQRKVVPILRNIAQSTKERGVDKGFRGIGRLGGLAYCEKLTFETSFKGEPLKSIMVWDAGLLKKIINNRGAKEEAAKVIETVTSYSTQIEDVDLHYFKVILEGVTNSELLNVREVRSYLSMVAPVPYETHFHFKSKIYEELKKDELSLDEYNIYINTEQLYKAYSSILFEGEEGNKKKVGEIFDLIFFSKKGTVMEICFTGVGMD